MDILTEMSKYIPGDVRQIVYKMLYDDVLSQLRRTVEPWYDFTVDACGCEIILAYPAYTEDYGWGSVFEEYVGPYWEGKDDDLHHGPQGCEQNGCPSCQLCASCFGTWQYYDMKD